MINRSTLGDQRDIAAKQIGFSGFLSFDVQVPKLIGDKKNRCVNSERYGTVELDDLVMGSTHFESCFLLADKALSYEVSPQT